MAIEILLVPLSGTGHTQTGGVAAYSTGDEFVDGTLATVGSVTVRMGASKNDELYGTGHTQSSGYASMETPVIGSMHVEGGVEIVMKGRKTTEVRDTSADLRMGGSARGYTSVVRGAMHVRAGGYEIFMRVTGLHLTGGVEIFMQANMVDASMHVEGDVDIVFAGGGSYVPGNQDASMHVEGSVDTKAWGGSVERQGSMYVEGSVTILISAGPTGKMHFKGDCEVLWQGTVTEAPALPGEGLGIEEPELLDAIVQDVANAMLRRSGVYAEIAKPVLEPGWAITPRLQTLDLGINGGQGNSDFSHTAACRMGDMKTAVATVSHDARLDSANYFVSVRIQEGTESFGQAHIAWATPHEVTDIHLLSAANPLNNTGVSLYAEKVLILGVAHTRIDGPFAYDILVSLDRGQNWTKVYSDEWATDIAPSLVSGPLDRVYLFWRDTPTTNLLYSKYVNTPPHTWVDTFGWTSSDLSTGISLLHSPYPKQYDINYTGGRWNVGVTTVVRSSNPQESPDVAELTVGFRNNPTPTSFTVNSRYEPLALNTTNAIEWVRVGRIGASDEFGKLPAGRRVLLYSLRTSGQRKMKYALADYKLGAWTWLEPNRDVPFNGDEWQVDSVTGTTSRWEELWTPSALDNKDVWLGHRTPSTRTKYELDDLLGPSLYMDSRGTDDLTENPDSIDSFAAYITRSNPYQSIAFPPYIPGRSLTVDFSMHMGPLAGPYENQRRTRWYHNMYFVIDDPLVPGVPIFRADYYEGTGEDVALDWHPHDGYNHNPENPRRGAADFRIHFCKELLTDNPVHNQMQRNPTTIDYFHHPIPWAFSGYRKQRDMYLIGGQGQTGTRFGWKFRITYTPLDDKFRLYWIDPFIPDNTTYEPFIPYKYYGELSQYQGVYAEPATDRLWATSHGYGLNQQLEFSTTGTLPAPLSPATTYYVVEFTANSFKVSATLGGGVVNLTDTGTGNHSVRNVTTTSSDTREYVDVGGSPDFRDLYVPHATEKYWEQPRRGMWPRRIFIGNPDIRPAVERQTGMWFGGISVESFGVRYATVPAGKPAFIPRLSGSWDLIYADERGDDNLYRHTYGYPWQDVFTATSFKSKWNKNSGPDNATLQLLDIDNQERGSLFGSVRGWHGMVYARAGYREGTTPENGYVDNGAWGPWVCNFFGSADTGQPIDNGDGPRITMQLFSPLRQLTRSYKTQGFSASHLPAPTESGGEIETTEEKVREHQIIYQSDKEYPNDPNRPWDTVLATTMHYEDYISKYTWHYMLDLPSEKLDLPRVGVRPPHFTVNPQGGDADLLADLQKLWGELGLSWYYDYFSGGVLRVYARETGNGLEAAPLTLKARSILSVPFEWQEDDYSRAGNVAATTSNLESRPNYVSARPAPWPDGTDTVEKSLEVLAGMPSQHAAAVMLKKDTATHSLVKEWEGARQITVPLHAFPYLKPSDLVSLQLDLDLPQNTRTRYARLERTWEVDNITTEWDAGSLVSRVTLHALDAFPIEGQS